MRTISDRDTGPEELRQFQDLHTLSHSFHSLKKEWPFLNEVRGSNTRNCSLNRPISEGQFSGLEI